MCRGRQWVLVGLTGSFARPDTSSLASTSDFAGRGSVSVVTGTGLGLFLFLWFHYRRRCTRTSSGLAGAIVGGRHERCTASAGTINQSISSSSIRFSNVLSCTLTHSVDFDAAAFARRFLLFRIAPFFFTRCL